MGKKRKKIGKPRKNSRLVFLPSPIYIMDASCFRYPRWTKTSRTFPKWERELSYWDKRNAGWVAKRKMWCELQQWNSKFFRKDEPGTKVRVRKRKGRWRSWRLTTGWLDQWLTTYCYKGRSCLLTRDGVPKDPDRSRHAQEKEGKMTLTLLPFVRPGSL